MTAQNLVIIDSGVANLTSVTAAIDRLNVPAQVTSDPDVIQAASHVILPGVGAAKTAMDGLQKKGLITTLKSLKTPVLGICLGMQLLFEKSEESEGTEGLGVIPGTVSLLPPSKGAPIPHMGWNQISVEKQEHPLLKDIPTDSYFYFVHSYAASLNEMTIASSYYGTKFTAMVARDNFMGCQFHPERSSSMGQIILSNFLGM